MATFSACAHRKLAAVPWEHCTGNDPRLGVSCGSDASAEAPADWLYRLQEPVSTHPMLCT